MGMDIYGKNPIENKKKSDFPMLVKVDKLEKKEEWKERRELIDTQSDNYWKERNEYENANKGIYFRNNCWWWRPLWNYCYHVADDIISEELYESGHSNSGAGLNAKNAEWLGERLLDELSEGNTIEYQARYQQMIGDLDDDDFNKEYPFDVDNVKAFAEFCIESGGFEIC